MLLAKNKMCIVNKSSCPRAPRRFPFSQSMSRSARLLAAAFALGIVAGIFVQHRWPLGRLRDRLLDPAPPPAPAAVTPADLAALPSPRRLVLLVSGQSHAANHGSVRAQGGPGVHVFHDGELLRATDPLPGGDARGGSIWTRLGARLINTGDYDAIVLAIAAQGSSSVADWAPGGALHPRLETTLRQLSAAGLPPDFFLWLQGETEAWQPDFPGPRYAASLEQLLATVRASAPRATSLVALSTFASHTDRNAQIRAAQGTAATLPQTLPGPDLDTLDARHRAGGVHFNEAGLEAAADLWLAALRPALEARRRP
jgi:Carbohydrate esterase, sialic acid-specific acetylesterase